MSVQVLPSARISCPTASLGVWAPGRRLRRLLALACAALALLSLGQAGWVHAKAAVAQVLLERAWQRSSGEAQPVRPWPWADTHPVARLHAPSLQRSQIVLAGDSGRVLAFGPGWAPASAAPGDAGTTVISGHRDTHFAWLAALRIDDPIRIETHAGRHNYRVREFRVVDADHERIALDDEASLLLVTCWPFDAVASGPLRYVVRAEVDDQRLSPTDP